MALPEFFVIGAPKAGTTALHVALARHPQLFMSRVKEPKFFLTQGPPPQRGGPGDARTYREYVWRREEYEALFDEAPGGTLAGESTPFYLYDADAQRRIHEAVPQARLVALLRDPVDRAHSNWAHLWSAGLEPERDFVTACGLEGARRAQGWAPFWRYLDLGRYGEQLERLYTRFPRENVLVLRYWDLREHPVATLDRIFTFLGVEPGLVGEIPAENVTTHISHSRTNAALASVRRTGVRLERLVPERWWHRASASIERRLQREQRLREPLTVADREALIPMVADDVATLERVTGQSFADWLDTGRRHERSALRVAGPIGTAHNSIDRPIRD
jgi:Sulfotransferase family